MSESMKCMEKCLLIKARRRMSGERPISRLRPGVGTAQVLLGLGAVEPKMAISTVVDLVDHFKVLHILQLPP